MVTDEVRKADRPSRLVARPAGAAVGFAGEKRREAINVFPSIAVQRERAAVEAARRLAPWRPWLAFLAGAMLCTAAVLAVKAVAAAEREYQIAERV